MPSSTSSPLPATSSLPLPHDLAHLSAIVQSTDDAIIGKSLGATITSWNPGAERLYGYTAEEAVGRHISLCVPAERWAETEDALNRVLRGERLAHYETVRERKSGERIDVSVRLSPVLDAAGAIIGASSISRDITDRKRAERQERAEHAVARVAAEASSIEEAGPRLLQALREGLLVDLAELHVVGRDGRLVCLAQSSASPDQGPGPSSWPEEARRLGRPIWFSDAPMDNSAPMPEDADRLGFCRGFAAPSFHGADCVAVVTFYAKSARPSDVGLLPTLAAIAQTIGQLVRRSRAEAELRAAVQRRDRFLAMLSHELRNPLAAVRAATLAMQRSVVGHPEQYGPYAVISRQVHHMSRLLDGLLDVTRVTHDRLKLECERLDLETTVAAAVEMVEPMAREHGVTLATDGPAETLMVNGDRVRIVQLIGNVLSNAIKYSPSGSTVLVAVAGEGKEAAIRVIDHGAGMNQEVLDHAFDLFYQADETLDRRESGMGIGLTLARTIAELHGGTLSALSDGAGCGSELVVRLPRLLTAAEKSAPVAGADQGKHYRIVLVEDNEDNREMIRLLLGYEGHEVEVAANGADGLVAIERFKPDVALVDIGLPGIDGLAVARRVRADASLDGVGLIALSGYAQTSDVERATSAGFDAHVAKPVTPEQLLQVVEKVVAVRDDRRPPSQR